ncbi:hypothetical protein [Paenibacillus piri]|uniref:Serine/threonine protein kinase n=1 Tax=Paenibacillus piri TaxID=2547395 RepID=A0A4R5KBV0_9BACL|nr:hypothetical protein [Paenibacillus piri]TDF92566.1 hypothetical protein E1757_29740 [Paenibacillus piri]
MDMHHVPSDADLIGRGKQGAVYKLSSDRCLKWYVNERHARLECRSYHMAAGSPLIPKLYGCGPQYIVMEYIQGECLQKVLRQKRALTMQQSGHILYIIDEMTRLGFTRIDIALAHIFIQETQTKQVCKIIDLVHAYSRVYDIPKVLFKGLFKLGLLAVFLEHAKELDREKYEKWIDHVRTRSDRYGSFRTYID